MQPEAAEERKVRSVSLSPAASTASEKKCLDEARANEPREGRKAKEAEEAKEKEQPDFEEEAKAGEAREQERLGYDREVRTPVDEESEGDMHLLCCGESIDSADFDSKSTREGDGSSYEDY